MYTTDHIFHALPIKNLVNQDGEPTIPHKMATAMKPTESNLHLLFCTYVVQKETANVGIKALNMLHQPQKCFCGIFVEIT